MNINNLTETEQQDFYRLLKKMNGEEPDKKQDVKVKKPRQSEEYFCISNDGAVIQSRWTNDSLDEGRWELGNVFFTEESAWLAREKRKVEVELERYAKEHNDPTLEDSYFILHDEYNEELDYDMLADCRPQGAVVFTSKQLVFDAIESIGRDRILKYIFGVESVGEE
jgi:hypothetical protein